MHSEELVRVVDGCISQLEPRNDGQLHATIEDANLLPLYNASIPKSHSEGIYHQYNSSFIVSTRRSLGSPLLSRDRHPTCPRVIPRSADRIFYLLSLSDFSSHKHLPSPTSPPLPTLFDYHPNSSPLLAPSNRSGPGRRNIRVAGASRSLVASSLATPAVCLETARFLQHLRQHQVRPLCQAWPWHGPDCHRRRPTPPKRTRPRRVFLDLAPETGTVCPRAAVTIATLA